MAPKQRRSNRRTRGGRAPQNQPPSPNRAAAAAATPVQAFSRGPRRFLLMTLAALVATVAIAAGLFTVVRSGGSTSCDADANGWNGAGGGMRNTGYAAISITDPGKTWSPSWTYPPRSAQGSDRVVAPPSVANGSVYTATANGTLVAVDAAKGSMQWTSAPQQNEEGTVAVPIALDGCAAAVATAVQSTTGEPTGVLRAVDLRTHQRRWSVHTADEVISPPQVVDGVAYAGVSLVAPSGGLDRIHVLDGYYLNDGSRAYRKSFNGAVLASPTSDHNRVWIGDLDQNLYALGHQAKQLWTYTTNGIISLPAVYDGSSVVVASADHSVASLDPGSGREHWSVQVGEVQAPMAVTGGVVVVAGVDGVVHALHAGDGSEMWHADMGSKVSHAVVAAGDRIFVVDDDGTLHVLDRATGTQTTTWTAPAPPAGPPAIAAGHLYLTCQDGRLYALPL